MPDVAASVTVTPAAPAAVAPNMPDWARARREFSWVAARRRLDGLPAGRGLNIAHEAVDRHVRDGRGGHVALRCIAAGGLRREITYAALKRSTNGFAAALESLGVQPGDRVCTVLGRTPELVTAALGALKARAVFAPLSVSLGPESLAARIAVVGPRVLVTTQSLWRRLLAGFREALPGAEHVILVRDEAPPRPRATLDWHALLRSAPTAYRIGPTSPDDPALLHFTGGTTGTPKAALHAHDAVVAHHVTGLLALDLHPDDVTWCTADTGWMTSTVYGIVAPLVCGASSVVDEGEFDAERWHRVLADERVSVWYTAPTAIRMLMTRGIDLARRHAASRLRFLASVGEPLEPEAVAWGSRAFGLPVHDTWWQTETGAIMIANCIAEEIRPGSMGRPLPGIEAAIVERLPGGGVRELPPGAQGEIALRPGWPSMFRGYLGLPERSAACFVGGWYLTGDLARRDEDGYFWFVGRSDDVIETSGHLVGPFEVESVLVEHPAVAEAGVIGKPDPAAYEIVKAFVTLKGGFAADEPLCRGILAHARRRLGTTLAPREIEFVPALPRTGSGTIVRRLLRAREAGRVPEAAATRALTGDPPPAAGNASRS
ncbi:MAG: acetate--CoA ligase [Planctomycetaceae bacterium]